MRRLAFILGARCRQISFASLSPNDGTFLVRFITPLLHRNSEQSEGLGKKRSQDRCRETKIKAGYCMPKSLRIAHETF